MLFFLMLIVQMPGVEAKDFPGASLSADDYFYGKTPDKSVKNWIRIILLTPRNSPSPVFLISPTKFDVRPPQILIDLTAAQYAGFVQYSRANRCKLVSKKFLPADVLEAAEYSDGHSQILCRMSQIAACRYLNGIGSLPNIGWTEPKWQIFKRVHINLRCR